MFEETIDFWKVNLPKMTIIYFINLIVAEEKCLREESIRENAVCLMKNIFWHLMVIYLRHFWSKMQIQDGELVNHQLVIGQPWYEVVE